MRLWEVEAALQKVSAFESPKLNLEQYPTGSHIASHMIYSMHNTYDDLEDKSIVDLGCGTAMLGIGCSLFEAGSVIGLDIDPDALSTALSNAETTETDIDFVNCDLSPGIPSCFRQGFFVDTVVMNPPFGTRKKGIDAVFLRRAMEICSGAIYSLHKSSTRDFLTTTLQRWGADVEVVAQLRFDIPAMYSFHKKKSMDIELGKVDLLRCDVSKFFEKRMKDVEKSGADSWRAQFEGITFLVDDSEGGRGDAVPLAKRDSRERAHMSKGKRGGGSARSKPARR